MTKKKRYKRYSPEFKRDANMGSYSTSLTGNRPGYV